jgi:hypothetical protein
MEASLCPANLQCGHNLPIRDLLLSTENLKRIGDGQCGGGVAMEDFEIGLEVECERY